ncbi:MULTISPECIES: FtsW/RodA/SpoVE family cell cycle protein [Streptomyces]|jgi:cell division protein FtsW (lipid II flippase)|uniref:Cell elongation-specific peptidoglycan biosynthesis regulator RodA n=2 Tax=Streptomyces griseoaurantiacus TaxID=68213 RepID=A0A1G7F6V9_9ACTN|nr:MULTISPECIES: FtsW/RodA/SpoVE family cell cycle protein [Streptomyces]MBA5224372.1 FtsW/RodA/SpoVE family cell cycle protein [Streptomyces griseoaurantiacus]MCF0090910.1 putative FtsW-like protein [Streptomyces sp. MH192]MCF0100981.1 putative FtsW-like protein [Streptomyces sp. MH191]MDX3092903.1 FtsW/RodA/SpoVE family cell cycle protein [Streptomyces sp. ME12-02E]MDX3336272.1 FtsW/RodA/SpoVE family cell cycle protein [Streptomyces sp. ME02-6978a]
MSSTTNTSTHHTSTIGSIGTPSRRNTELALLLFAVAIPVFAYANVGLAINDQVPPGLLGYGVGLGLLAGVGHLVVRKFAPYADPLMLPLATLLNGLGLVVIWRLDQSKRLQALPTFVSAAPRQLLYTALGIALFVAVLIFLKDHRVLQRYTYISMMGALVLLVLPLVPGLGANVYGAKIWISIPGLGTLQPGEFAKIVLAVFFAGYLMVKRDALALASRRFMGLYLPRGRDLGPIVVVWIISILVLVFETDLGTSLLFFGMFVVMLYVATERTSWIVFGLLMSAVGAVGVASFEPHVQQRVQAWLNPLREYKLSQQGVFGHSEQSMEALWAFGSGGTMGTGLGQGNSDLIKFAANSDFILATFGEELGLAGLMAILLLYGLIVERGVRTALAARDPFGKLLAVGLSGAFALQVFVVAGGVMGLIPLTGMTMPFLAYGGSSVIANWALIGILLRISDTARRPAPAPAPNPDAEMTQVVRP